MACVTQASQARSNYAHIIQYDQIIPFMQNLFVNNKKIFKVLGKMKIFYLYMVHQVKIIKNL